MEVMKTIDVEMLTKMFLAGAKNLEAKKEWINELNVFPVPDGDTGTNMTLTIMSAASEVNGLPRRPWRMWRRPFPPVPCGGPGKLRRHPVAASARLYEGDPRL